MDVLTPLPASDAERLAAAASDLADALSGLTTTLADGDPVLASRITRVRISAARTLRAIALPAAWLAQLPMPPRHIRVASLARWVSDNAGRLWRTGSLDGSDIRDLIFLAAQARALRRDAGVLPSGRLVHACEEVDSCA